MYGLVLMTFFSITYLFLHDPYYVNNPLLCLSLIVFINNIYVLCKDFCTPLFDKHVRNQCNELEKSEKQNLIIKI